MATAHKVACVALGTALAVSAIPAQAADTDLVRAWAAGYRAQFTCSALWNGDGKSLSDIERDELSGIYPEIEAQIRSLKADVDAKRHRVSVRYRDDMPPRVAQWSGSGGCVALPIGAKPADVDGSAPAARANLDARPWPLGDIGALAPDPRGGRRPVAIAAAKAGDFGGRTSAVLIVKDGKIVSEWYQPGYGMHTAQRTWSVAKSLAGTLIGHAVLRDGIDVAQPAAIAEWRAAGDPRAMITTEQLMRMASGLTSDSAGNRTDAVYMGGASVRQWTTLWPLLNPPGSSFRYANNDILLAVLSAQAASGTIDPVAFFDKLGMTRTFAEHDKDGSYILSSQVWTTARDLARLGLLYLNDGVAGGERLLPADWRAFVSRPSGPQPEGAFGYGATFWLMNKSEGIPADTFAAFGNRGQYLVIVPSRRMVIVRRGYDSADTRFDIEAFTRAIVAADVS